MRISRGLWSNPEWKRAAAFILLFFCILSLLAVLCMNILLENMNRQLLQRNIATAGALISEHPELKDEIFAAFTREAGSEEFQKGLENASEYGYTENLPLSILPLMKDYQGQVNRALLLLFTVNVCVLLVLVGMIFSRFYKRIRKAALAAERMVDGDFAVRLDEDCEGDLSKLGYQFNRMSRQLELSLDRLRSEKVFLKNILSDISHQLKTPLSSLKVYHEILLNERAKERVDQQRFLSLGAGQLDRMEWLIHNLLVLARIEAGALDFDRSADALYPTVEGAVQALRVKWEEKRQCVVIEEERTGGQSGDRNAISFPHDEKWLGEAIGNMIKNSIEHTPQGGHITVRITETPLFVQLLFTDNGEGIHPEDLPHIFQRFYRGKTHSKGSGTGIGLALAKSIIEGHGGIISASSKLGAGTVFTVTFPKIGI